MASIAYRFLLSGVILLVYCKVRGLNLRYTWKQHGHFALLALLLFSFNYWVVYLAEMHITSGLVSVVFCTIVFFNVLFSALFLKTPIRWPVVIGGTIGIAGVGLIFFEELRSFDLSDKATVALIWLFFGAMMASLGNIASQRNQSAGLPVLQTNAFGMLYGSLMMFALALATSTPLRFDMSLPYIASMIYLALFGSIIGFGAYLTLVGNIGADKAGYIALLIPIIALLLSTVFEDYHWPPNAIGGVALVLLGNFFALRKKRSSA